ncbi:MAG TPA: DUF4124 domain-containing protein [Gammaproteobacteria bacterium]|nr:DUF4124 domain-containing protein [Gammaproteobacteria bacterium]
MHKTLTATLLFILMVSAGLAVQADAVYKWVDAQGNVHYTDHPRPGAEKVQLPKTQTYQPSSPVDMSTPAPQATTEVPTAGYQQLNIASPASQATLWYVDEVPVTVSLTPALRSGDTLTYHLDGQSIGPTTETTVTFKNIPRGEHTVSVTLNAANGATLSAGPVTFFVQQKSILSPKPPR